MNPQPSSKAGDDSFGERTSGWKEMVRRYQFPSKWKSAWQLTNTLGPYFSLWLLMYFSLRVSYWLVVPLAVFAGAFLARTFVIFHDCAHGSFFKSKTANEVTGFLLGVLVFTPYHYWRWQHSIHHSSSGDLDRRGMGDVWTLTVQEYLESSRLRRFAYRLSRNPLILFVVAPLVMFVVYQRLSDMKAGKRERRWVHATNLVILLVAMGLSWIFGIKAYLIIQLTAIFVLSVSGVWLFYVQHQYEDAYWERRPNWDYAHAALEGSSFYKLPRILQWFSGNIGFHHVHHLSPRIPNYELERAHKSEPIFQKVEPLTIRKSLKSLSFRLWDEGRRRFTGFKSLRRIPRKKSKVG